MELDAQTRRGLTRLISQTLNANPREILANWTEAGDEGARHRLGFAGPPGVGKSSMIAKYARHRLARETSVGVLAVDPSSPEHNGAILGDRIRMDCVSEHPSFFLRSVPSRSAHDGLCENASSLMDVLARAGFDEIVLETVGVGQGETSIRSLVDTLILMAQPGSGDAIQAMKSGLLETADIIVIGKGDRPDAKQACSELEQILSFREKEEGDWEVPVLIASATRDVGIEELAEAVSRHWSWLDQGERASTRRKARENFRVAELAGQMLSARFRSSAQIESPVEFLLRLADVLEA